MLSDSVSSRATLRLGAGLDSLACSIEVIISVALESHAGASPIADVPGRTPLDVKGGMFCIEVKDVPALRLYPVLYPVLYPT